MRVKWLHKALRDLDGHLAFIAQDDPTAAARVADAIQVTASLLAHYPDLGRSGRVSGTREVVVPGLPYLIIYRVRADAVHVLRVRHGAQKWPLRH